MDSKNQKLVEKATKISEEIKKAVLGKDDVIHKIIIAILASGHILLEDIPGVGKTTLALAYSKATSLDYKRLQFTPDVLPTDVTGFSIYDKSSDSFKYKPGAAMCNLFLADEINRTSSKTQSALLEIMEEGNVTVDGVCHELPSPYTVIATQNPIGYVGTQMLPESQLDRFMVRLSMGYPAADNELDILKGKQGADPMQSVTSVASAKDIVAMRTAAEQVYTHDQIFGYIVNLVNATRESELLSLGVSPRGSIAIAKLARAHAFMEGRDFVVPDDITDVFIDCCAHRVTPSPKAKIGGLVSEEILVGILKQVKAPGITS